MKQFCPKCNAIVAPIEKTRCDFETGKSCSPDGSVCFWTHHLLTLSLCPACQHPFLIESLRPCSTDDEYLTPPDETILYPPEIKSTKYTMPDFVDRLYQQAKMAFQTNSYDICVLACRTVIESICREKGVEKNAGLNAAIATLKTKGLIDNQLLEWFNLVRALGNQAAHDFEVPFTKDEASDCLEFVEAICDYVYYLTPKFAQVKERMALKQQDRMAAETPPANMTLGITVTHP